jgi:hypothetical protein
MGLFTERDEYDDFKVKPKHMLTIADMKAMYDRYLEQLNWYEDRLKQGVYEYDQELIDEYTEKIKELQIKVFNIGKQMEEAMEQAYIDNIKYW